MYLLTPTRNPKIFHSTKNVRKQTVSKPNTNDASKALTVLQKTDITVCAICYREDDPSNETDITWVECSECGIWVHTFCLSATGIQEDYICDSCIIAKQNPTTNSPHLSNGLTPSCLCSMSVLKFYSV